MLTDDKDRVVTASTPIPESPGKIFELPEIPDAPEVNEIEFISLTLSEIKDKADDELKEILSGEYQPNKALSMSMQLLISTELRQRSHKPHWSVNPTFFLTVAAVAIAAIGMYFTYLGFSQSGAHDQSKLTQEKSNSNPETLPIRQIPHQKSLTDAPLEQYLPELSKTHISEIPKPEPNKPK